MEASVDGKPVTAEVAAPLESNVKVDKKTGVKTYVKEAVITPPQKQKTSKSKTAKKKAKSKKRR